jgi:hypothetical protein
MVRLTLFHNALDGCKRLQVIYPASRPIQSIIAQLDYLIALETGQCSDRTRLKDINIGVLAAREVEDMDMQVAELLHTVSAEARRM